MKKFIGRSAELERLNNLKQKSKASFVVIKGRRRIGKSRLSDEFSKNFKNYYSFSGLPPEKNVTNADQLKEFCAQMAREFNMPYAEYKNWSDAFWALGNASKDREALILFDEISWMGSKDPSFLGQIKNLWDLHLSKNSKLVFIICGSASSWIEKNILSSTGFVGRVSLTIELAELGIKECNQFWPKHISSYEKLKILSVVGGVPKYLEEVDFSKSAEHNIQELCFKKGGFLVDEFEKIFSDIFLRKSQFYKKILTILNQGAKTTAEIQKDLPGESQGRLLEYLNELDQNGFVSRDYFWDIKKGNYTKNSKYRLKDNYSRFYLRYIEKNLIKINNGNYSYIALNSHNDLLTIMGLQFENLILNNIDQVIDCLGIENNHIEVAAPYFQKSTKSQEGCQIDLLIKDKFSTFHVCEIKFSQNKIKSNIIKEINNKIKCLNVAKQYSIRPVLIHVNGVEDSVVSANFFSKIIDFSSLFVV